MRYSIERVFHQLFYNRRRYALLWAELLAGSLVLSICTNLLFTSRNILEEYSRSMESQWVDVEAHSGYSLEELMAGELPTDYISVSYETYMDLEEKYQGDLDIAYASHNSLTAFLESDVVGIEMIFMNDMWFEHNFETGRVENTVYVGEKVSHGLELIYDAIAAGESINWFTNMDTGKHPELIYDGSTMKIGNTDTFQIKEMPYIPEEKQSFNPWMKYVGEEEQEGYVWIDDCVIFPVEAMQDIDKSEVNDWQVFIRVGGKNGVIDWDELMNLYSDIQDQAPQRCGFTLGSEYLEMEQHRKDLDWNAWYWLRISGATILLVTGSMTGVLLVMMVRRRRQKAIACVCGSTPIRLELEMLSEILLVLVTAAGLGDGIGRYLISSEAITYGSIQYDVRSSVILFVTVAVMLALVYGINYLLERRITYVQILKEE